MVESVVRASRRVNNSRDCEQTNALCSLLRSAATGVGRRVLSCFLDKDRHTELVELSVDPHTYENADVFWRDWMCVNLLSKYPKLNLGIDTAKIAEEKFRESEALCSQTNTRLSSRYDTPTLGVSGESLISAARIKIARLLGDFSWDDAEPFFGFSGGASTRQRRSEGDAYHKFSGKPDVTRSAALLAVCAIWSSPSWRDRMRALFGDDPCNWVNIVNGSRITTVPKNAKTDRVIAIEPCMNMYVQRGIGAVIRRKLKTVGINLNDQTRNQVLARKASLDGSLATLDLKAASDTISIELVRLLLPPDWYRAMDLCRSSEGTFASGETVTFQKFSSMGNGFTFELESLIFWALSKSVTDLCENTCVELSVYGDDIIVPVAASGWLVELLRYCGFETNESKSFTSGPFRESCGKHYFRGVDVTPIYIRSPITTLHRRYWFANAIRRWAARPLDGQVCDPRFLKAWSSAVAAIPRNRRFIIPDGVGDCGIIGDFTEGLPRFVRGMYVFSVLMEVAGRTVSVFDEPALLRCLSVTRRRSQEDSVASTEIDTSFNDLLVNREKIRVFRCEMRMSRWEDAGLWPVT